MRPEEERMTTVPEWFWNYFVTGIEPAEGEPAHDDLRSALFGVLYCGPAEEERWMKLHASAVARWDSENSRMRPPEVKGWGWGLGNRGTYRQQKEERTW
jgi:hypothetical protein